MEVTSGIFKAAGNIYSNNKGSILRTIIYTIGHFAIAITVLMLIADVPFSIALTELLKLSLFLDFQSNLDKNPLIAT